MRSKILIILLSCVALIQVNSLEGQQAKVKRDKFVMLTMPYNLRPLSLYKGQIQLNTGYKFAVRTQSFSATGEKTLLRKTGTGSVYHYYFIEMRYGLTDYIELGAESDFLRRGIRDETESIVNITLTSTEKITVNKLTESKGMGDLFIYAAIRLPIEYKWFDFSLKGGAFIPSAEFEPEKPDNTVTAVTAANSYTVNLHYNNSNGYGVPVYLIAAATKFTFRKFSAEAEWTLREPAKEGKNIRWEESMADKLFSYYDKSYSYLLSRTTTFDASLHYQATGWFNIYLNGSYFRAKGGWTEYWGNKYRNPEKKLINIEPGFELQISPRLTVYQIAGFPVSGKNNDAPFYLFTTFSFNIFPFMR